MPDSEREQATSSQHRTVRHPKELSPEYHKAHKQVILWAAILFVWEFVGIDLDKAKDAEGYAGALVKSIKSPQAVPWVLLGLVLYFLFKCSTEWAQCPTERRKTRFAKVDFISAWIVSLSAIGLYTAQAISRVQVADLIQGPVKLSSLVGGFAAGVVLGLLILRYFLYRVRGWHLTDYVLGGFSLLIVLGFMVLPYLGFGFSWTLLFVGATVGVILVAATTAVQERLDPMLPFFKRKKAGQ